MKMSMGRVIVCFVKRWRALCQCGRARTFSQREHMRFYVASSWMSPVCHRPRCPTTRQIMSILICTYPVRLMHAWHSNFTAQSQVCAASSGTGKPRFLYQMKKEKYSWIIEQIHDWQPGWWNSRRRKRKKEERTKIGIVKSIDAKDNFVWGLDTKEYCTKDKTSSKTYRRVSIRGEVSPL